MSRLLLLFLFTSPVLAQPSEFPLSAIAVTDGDTIKATAELGFNLSIKLNVRLLGINAPELNTIQGKASFAFLLNELKQHKSFSISKVKPDKYGGRWDAILWADGVNVNELMVATGHAVILSKK